MTAWTKAALGFGIANVVIASFAMAQQAGTVLIVGPNTPPATQPSATANSAGTPLRTVTSGVLIINSMDAATGTATVTICGPGLNSATPPATTQPETLTLPANDDDSPD